MKNNLLVISSGYPNQDLSYLSHTFLKGFVDEARYDFKKVNVVVLRPYFPFYKFFKNLIELKNYSYENINVFYFQ